MFGVNCTVITDNIFYFIILLAKQYIYRCKYEQSVSLVSVFRKLLKLRHKLEEYNQKSTFQENTFNARWHCYKTFFLLLEDTIYSKQKQSKNYNNNSNDGDHDHNNIEEEEVGLLL